MSLRDFVERYGVPVGALAVFALVLVLLPGNTEGSDATSVESGFAGSPTTVAGGPGDIGPGTPAPTVGGGSGGSGGGGGSSPSTQSGGSDPGTGGAPTTTVAAGGGGGGTGQALFGQGPHCRSDDRQAGFSSYMPPCVEWTGTDNGGVTSKGVTADEIKVALWFGQEDPATRQALAGARLSDPPEDAERIYDALRRYFNNHYETYGREVVFVDVQASGESTNDEAMKADAIRIADEVGAFAVFAGNALAPIPTTLAREVTVRGVVCICAETHTAEFYAENPPLVWDSLPSITEYAKHSAEYVAKKMGHEPAQYGGVGTQGLPRVYCLMYLAGTGETVNPERVRAAQTFRDAFEARGISFKTEVGYFYDPGSNQNDVTAMILKFKNEGCTTIVPLVDPIMPILITREATNQQYFPEWFIVGTGLSDTTSIGRFYDQAQWGNAFGISPLWVTWDRVQNSAGYREYHHMNPGEEDGREGVLINVYRGDFQTLWTGIHMAGPTLSAKTFEEGMYAYPPTGGTPTNPLVFRTREFPTSIKDFSEVWYDPNRVGPDERSETGTGMIVRADGGQRYDAGEWPVSPPSRSDPVTVTPDQGLFDHDADGHTHDTRCLSCDS